MLDPNYRDQQLREMLQDEYLKRKDHNSRYSLRAYARDLGISSGSLSEAMAGKRLISKTNLLKISDRLQWKPATVNRLLNMSGFKSDPTSENHEFRSVNDDLIAAISEWHYLAILNLAKLGCPCEASYIADRLSLPESVAQEALNALIRLGLAHNQNGSLRRTTRALISDIDVPSRVRRDYFRQHLNLAEKTLDATPIDERDFSVVTIPADRKMLPQAKVLIEEFRRKIGRLLESGHPDRVYSVAIQMYPISDVKEGKNP